MKNRNLKIIAALKILKVIKSCTMAVQLLAAFKMIKNFEIQFKNPADFLKLEYEKQLNKIYPNEYN